MVSNEIKKGLEKQLNQIIRDFGEIDSVDYLVLDCIKWTITPQHYEYGVLYDQYGDVEEGELVIKSDIPHYSYMFDSCILDNSGLSYFLNEIDLIITCRDRVERVCNIIIGYAEEISENYNQRPFAQILFNVAQGKLKKNVYKNEDDYNERCIASSPQEGIFVLDSDNILKFDVNEDDIGDIFCSHKVDYDKLKIFIIESLSCYYGVNLLYPSGYYELLCNFEIEQKKETMKEKVKVALKGIKFYVEQSLTKNYKDTDVPIVYLSLTVPFENQDILVMSRMAAQGYLSKENADEKKEYLSKCEVVYSEEDKIYGIVAPPLKSRTIAEYVF